MRLLIYPSPAMGHLFPIVPVALELQRRGHDVFIRTYSKAIPLVRAAGLKAGETDPRIGKVENDDYTGSSSGEALARGVATFVRRAPLEQDDLRSVMAQTTCLRRGLA